MNAKDRAYAMAKEKILRGEWEPGTLLSEAVVGQGFGMSRTPVHAAFVQLATEGLIELRTRHGAVVSPISRVDSVDLLEVREALEAAAARRSMRSWETSRDLAADLRHALESQEEAILAGDSEGFARADERFHTLIVGRSGNRIAINIFQQLGDRQERLRRHALSGLTLDRRELLDEHEMLLLAVERQDADEFVRVLHAHLARQLGLL